MDTSPQKQPAQNNSAQFSSDSMIKDTSDPTSSSMPLYGGIAAVVIIAVAIGGYFLTTHHKNRMASSIPYQQTIQQTQNTVSTISPTPVISPVTSANVDQTLNNTGATMQQSMNQVDSDLNTINTIDPSQDGTNGL